MQGVGDPGRVQLLGAAGHHVHGGPNFHQQPNNVLPKVWKLPGPPSTSSGQYNNMLLIIGSVG